MKNLFTILFAVFLFLSGCEKDNIKPPQAGDNYSSADYPELVQFTNSSSSTEGQVYEVLPGPAAINPGMSPTPFSDNTNTTTGSYSFEVSDQIPDDSENSQDAVTSVNIQFTGNDGTKYLIDEIRVIHKAKGTGDHTFFGGVGLNKIMHGNTGIGTGLMPKMLSYITLWGLTDLKNAETGAVIAPDRLIHIMSTTNVRDKNFNLMTNVEVDSSDYNIKNVQTHIILPPQNTKGDMDPVPGTDHGFLHMMFEKVNLDGAQRDWKLAYEILPGPAEINTDINPTPFSDKIGLGAGSYTLKVSDLTDEDSENSEDSADEFSLVYQRQNGKTFKINKINIIHKQNGSGDHTFFGGVGLNKVMHGNTGVGTALMPKLTSYITLWGTADLLDGDGNVLVKNRLIHIMVTGRVRDEDLNLITNTTDDLSDKSPDKIETHIIIPPQDMAGNPDPVPGTRHGFLHLMFEQVNLEAR